jgi:hypothetical protein
MLANRTIMGISMNRRHNRRWLVMAMYLLLAVLFATVVYRHDWLLFLFFPVVLVVNPLLFGEFLFWGKKYGGLVKPFHSDREQPNDERELAARDRAHYRAYGWVLISFFLILLIGGDWFPERPRYNMSPAQFLYLIQSLVWGAWTLAMTLPQAILLWTEPDIESEKEEMAMSNPPKTEIDSKLSLRIPRHLR